MDLKKSVPFKGNACFCSFLQAQGVKSWKMHVHEKSVWEVFSEEARLESEPG